MKTNILFFSFNTKKVPGKIVAQGVRFETLELPLGPEFDETKFKVLCEDHPGEFHGIDLGAFKEAVQSNFPSVRASK